MIKSYFTIAFRNITRNKVASFINIFGLAIGIASCIFIFIFVRNEESYDKKNPNADRIYRVVSDMTLTGKTDHLALSSFLLSPTLKADYPEIETAARFLIARKQTIWVGNQVHQLEDVFFTDSSFFAIFPYIFVSGNPKTALIEPYTIVLTEESAKLIFGTTQNITGKMLKFARASYKVSGVIKAPANESHLKFSALISMPSLAKPFAQSLSRDWFYMTQSNYILFKTKEAGEHFEPKFKQFEDKYILPFLVKSQVQGRLHFGLQHLKDIHLGKISEQFEYADVGNKSYIYIFSVVAIFILLIACINYMNLATARSTKRAKEVGIRKTSGATRMQLVQQFIGESVIITFISVVLALCITELLLPFFNNLTDKSLSISISDFGLLGFIFLVILLVGILSGLYPAFFLSGFQPIQVLKANNNPKSGSANLRKVLVVVQFSVSIILIIGTLVVFLQMHYVKNKDIGFNKENVYVITTPPADSSFVSKFQELKNELKANPHVLKMSGTDEVPGTYAGTILQFVTNDQKTEERLMNIMAVDYDYLSLMDIPLVKGRNFSKDFASDDTAAFIVNEASVKAFGWKDPMNIKMSNALGYNGKIIGITKDFNYESLHKAVEPAVMYLPHRMPGFLVLKLKGEDLRSTISFIETKWKMFSKRYPMEAFFLEDNFNKQYRADEKMLTIFAWFSSLTIIIACMGLLALASFTTEQRTKEIGIRKVLGASSFSIVSLLTKDFMKLVLVALVIAAPVAWYAMDKWLRDFAYRIEVNVWMILAAAVVAFLVALLTVSYQAIKAALQNPADSVKYE